MLNLKLHASETPMDLGSVSFDVLYLQDTHRSAKTNSNWISLYEC